MKKSLLILLFFITLTGVAQNTTPVEVECNPIWQQNILGICMGNDGMYVDDYNGNGRDELILNGYRVWNIVEYVPALQSYQIIWGSKEYSVISKVFIADGDNDGNQEICILHNEIHLELYDLYTHHKKSEFVLPLYGSSLHRYIASGDVDNDGMTELVVMHSDFVYIFRITNGVCEQILSFYHTANDARCGDVNGDGLNELVFNSGHIYSIINGQYELIWDFLSYSMYFGLIELADIDNDNIPEIINIYNGVKVFDADLQSMKWQIPGVWAGGVTVDNIDNTGLPEIIYTEDQWGDVVCVEASNGAERWRVDHPDSDATDVRVGDTDGDGNKEFMFGTSCDNSGPDHLIFYQIPDLTMEYISVHDRGNHRTIRVDDVDNDGSNELITLSKGSETFGTGIFSVYNAETKQLEWRSNDSLTWLQNSSMHAMQIADVDNDSDLEYVIASGHGNNPAITVINARTHVLDTIKVWESFGDDPFYVLTIADLNSDGILEYIAGSDDSLCIINSQTLEKTRTFYDDTVYDFSTPVAGNIDSDPNTELVYVKYNVFVFDGLTEETWVVDTGERFMCCLMYDYNNDNITDIIASTYAGNIYLINGISHEATIIAYTGFPVTDLQMADIAGNSEPEIIYTYDKNLYIMNKQGEIFFTQILDDNTYSDIYCQITDYNNDGIDEIFIGSGLYVQQFDAECYNCINLNAGSQTTPTLCNGSTGTATVYPVEGTEPYSYLWSTGSTNATAENLSAGIHQVTITDSVGCVIVMDVDVPELAFELNSVTTTADNINTEQCEGSVTFHTSGGTPPYYCYLDNFWFTLTDSTFYGLCYGNYVMDLRDANYCFTDAIVSIPLTTQIAVHDGSMAFTISPNPSTGTSWLRTNHTFPAGTYAEISSMQGTELKRIEITGHQTLIDLSHFSPGIYLLTLFSSEGKRSEKIVVR